MAFRLSELAEMVGGRVDGDPGRPIEAVRTLEDAGPNDLSFVTNPRYRRQAVRSRAGALLTSVALEGVDKDFLLADDPYYALAKLMASMFPHQRLAAGVHPTAIVGQDVEIAPDAAIGPYVVIGDGVRIERGVEVHSHVFVGSGSVVGGDSIVYPRVVIYPGCVVGECCILHAGVVLGSDGFGYALHDGVHVKLQHGGNVVLGDGVEIGANSTVDRSLLGETRIGDGSKIDNLVQVAHNVRLGRGCLLVSQSGVAGSSRLGDGVVLAGQTGVAGHLELGDGVQVAAKSAVFKSVEPGRKLAGIPAVDLGAWRRQQALVGRLGELKKRLERLEAEIMDGRTEGDGDG
jgi:UDP-3-O-[3-hydroxymyristoyl] glucosamine N-acyltransferase